MTDLEIDEAIREAWAIVYGGVGEPTARRRLAAALLAVTGGTQAHPHWVTPDDLWRDRLAVLAEQNAWLAAWGPRPGEPDCRVPPALLPESRTRRENAYLLWRSTVRVSTDVESESRTVRKRRNRGAGMTPNKPVLPAQGPGGADFPCPNPMTCVSVLHGCAGWRRRRSVSMLRISPSCRTNTMLTVATIFRGRSDA